MLILPRGTQLDCGRSSGIPPMIPMRVRQPDPAPSPALSLIFQSTLSEPVNATTDISVDAQRASFSFDLGIESSPEWDGWLGFFENYRERFDPRDRSAESAASELAIARLVRRRPSPIIEYFLH